MESGLCCIVGYRYLVMEIRKASRIGSATTISRTELGGLCACYRWSCCHYDRIDSCIPDDKEKIQSGMMRFEKS